MRSLFEHLSGQAMVLLAALAAAALCMLRAFTSASVTASGTGQTSEALGASGPRPEGHVAAFATTGATVSVKTNLKYITGWSFGHAGSPGVDEILSIDETITNFGQIAVVNGAVSVKRAATTTSGLIVSLTLWGY